MGLAAKHATAATSGFPPTCGIISVEIHQFAESLGNAIDAKDHFTRLHSEEVAVVAHILALAYGLSPAQAEHIHIAGHLHDIGKIGIADHILQKPGPLNAAEWEEIKLHPLIGANIIRPVGFLAASGVADMVYHHHERYDGLGYPEGLRGEAIPLGARIIALADGLSAMLQDRPYRAKLTFRQAVDEIMQSRETYYDPKVVQAFSAESDAIRAALISMGES